MANPKAEQDTITREQIIAPEFTDLSPEDQLGQLEQYARALEDRNLELLGEINMGYIHLLKTLAKKDPLKKEVIARRAVIDKEMKLIKVAEKEAARPEMERQALREVLERVQADELFDQYDKDNFSQFFSQLPEKVQLRYIQRLQNLDTKPNQATKVNSLRSITFEISRSVIAAEQGLENVDLERDKPTVEVDYTGYKKGTQDFSQPRNNRIKKSAIDFDVPVERDGQPYSYEVKNYPRMQFGETVGHRNQLLKYQEAVRPSDPNKEPLISGASVEVRGRVDLEFLKWAMGEAIDEKGEVPDVELIYTLELPSGREYRFVLKRAYGREGLRFINEERYEPEDMEVIVGLQKALSDKSLKEIISSTHLSEEDSVREFNSYFENEVTDVESLMAAMGELHGYDPGNLEQVSKVLRHYFEIHDKKKMFDQDEIIKVFSEEFGYPIDQDPKRAIQDMWNVCMAEPRKIGSKKLYDIYNGLREQNLYELLREKRIIVNTENAKSAVSEFATPDYVERSIVEYQEYLRQNPDIAKVKSSYMIKPERVPEAVDETMDVLKSVAGYENARAESPEEAQRRQEREKMGYTGRSEGVALDIEHVWIDAIYGMNVAGLDKSLIKKIKRSDLFFEPSDEGPNAVKFKFENMAAIEEAIATDLEMARHFGELSATQRENAMKDLKNLFRRTEFVRSYDWPERFLDAEKITDYVEGENREYMELLILDPRTEKYVRHADTNPAKIEDAERSIVRDNIKRAKEYITQLKETDPKRGAMMERQVGRAKDIEAALAQIEADKKEKMAVVSQQAKKMAGEIGKEIGQINGERKKLAKQMRSAGSLEEVAELRARIDELDARTSELNGKRKAAFAENQRISDEYAPQVDELYRRLEQLYKAPIPDKEWDDFALRIAEIKDQNILKFIYAVTPEGNVKFQEEIFRGEVTGRAAHSELAQGRNVYGAGEIVFSTHNETFHDVEEWRAWKDKQPEGHQPLVMTEINNGSGHYRPDAVQTLVYTKNLLEQKGLDVSQAELIDCILRGRQLKDASAF